MSAIAAWVASIAPTASLSMVKTSGLIPNGSLPPCGRCGCKAGTTSGCGRHCHVGECGRPGRMRGVTTATPSYEGHRYPVEIINHCVWLYFRFPLSFREVEELMLVRGVAVSYETIRRWCAKFGQAYANQLRRRRPRPGDKWHLDEVFVGINGRLRYLWRAVDQHGNVLDVLVQSRRNAVAAKRFFGKLLKGLRYGRACWSPTSWAATRSPTARSCRRWSTGGRGI